MHILGRISLNRNEETEYVMGNTMLNLGSDMGEGRESVEQGISLEGTGGFDVKGPS